MSFQPTVKPNRRAHHIYLFYGKQALIDLIEDFRADTPVATIAERMGVTRACVAQWKTALGRRSKWEPFDDVLVLLKEDAECD